MNELDDVALARILMYDANEAAMQAQRDLRARILDADAAGHSFAEIGEAINMTEFAVRTWVHAMHISNDRRRARTEVAR